METDSLGKYLQMRYSLDSDGGNSLAVASESKTMFKETNPKDSVGIKKVPFSTIPTQVIAEVGVAMLEGARKYGRSNYRVVGIKASVYYDAALRHLMAYWEGENIDPDSGLSHVTKAIATLFVLRDAMLNDKCDDDRPPITVNRDWLADLNAIAGEIVDRHPVAKAARRQVGGA